MPGNSYGGGSSTDQAERDIGGYPHSGQGDPSGITAKNIATMLQKSKQNGLSGLRKRDGKDPHAIDQYALRTQDDVGQVEPGKGFGGIKNLFQ